MWIMLNNAFLSCVQDRLDSNVILVRARRKGDITRVFGKRAKEVASTGTYDYPYRAWISRALLGEVMLECVGRIDYYNFKNSVKNNALHDAYMQVWCSMLAVEARKKLRSLFGDVKKPKPKLGTFEYDDDAESDDYLSNNGFALNRPTEDVIL